MSRAQVHGTEPIPLLEDLLGTWPELRVNIDPKQDEAVEPLVDVIRRTSSIGRVCIGSFSDARLKRIRKALGVDLCTSLGPKGVARLRLGSFGFRSGPFRANCVQIPPTVRGRALVDNRLIEHAHHLDLGVHVWTIDDPAEMHHLLDMGVDGIMTDRPALLREVLVARGQWFE